MRHLLRDIRFGLRLLLKNPGFTAVAVLTVALGIAATTAIFSVVHATFFAPLPYREADRLVMVWSQREGAGRNSNSPADFLDFKRETSVFEDLNAWTGRFVSLGSGGAPMQLEAGVPTPGFLPMLGFGHPLALGRDFLEAEGTPGREQVVILSYSLWQERFGGDRSILGQAPSSAATPHGTCESAKNAAASALTSAANDAWNFVRSRNRKPSWGGRIGGTADRHVCSHLANPQVG